MNIILFFVKSSKLKLCFEIQIEKFKNNNIEIHSNVYSTCLVSFVNT